MSETGRTYIVPDDARVVRAASAARLVNLSGAKEACRVLGVPKHRLRYALDISGYRPEIPHSRLSPWIKADD